MPGMPCVADAETNESGTAHPRSPRPFPEIGRRPFSSNLAPPCRRLLFGGLRRGQAASRPILETGAGYHVLKPDTNCRKASACAPNSWLLEAISSLPAADCSATRAMPSIARRTSWAVEF